jgi:hypothetical protein
VDESNFDGE